MENLKIYYISDIHTETYWHRWGEDRPPDSGQAVLVLAGDIGSLDRAAELEHFLTYASGAYMQVLYVLGNHEYYGCSDMAEALADYRKFCEAWDNVTVLEKEVIEVGGVRFAGTTLWTKTSEEDAGLAVRVLADYRYIQIGYRGVSVGDLNSESALCYSFLESAEADVIITHHRPFLEKSSPHKTLNTCFGSPYEELVGAVGASHWVYGHDHLPDVRVVEGTTMYNNCKGYLGEIAPCGPKAFTVHNK